MFEGRTEEAVVRSIMALRDQLQKQSVSEIARIRRLISNTEKAKHPDSMSWELRKEYDLEWTPFAMARIIIQKIRDAMYGRSIEHEIKGQEKNQLIADLLESWTRCAPGIYMRACSYGYTVTRFWPDWRRGLTWGNYDPDEVTPIFDQETEDLDPLGLIYHYGVDPASFPLPVATDAREVRIVEHITRHNRDRVTGEIQEPGQRRRWYYMKGVWHRWLYFDGDEGLNPYGDHLGAILWRNDDSLNGPWGESDILPVADLLDALSHTNTDLKLLLKWNLWPPMYSDSPGFADLPYSWRQMIELSGDGGRTPTIGRLEWEASSLKAGMDYLRLLLQLLHETTSVPAIAMGDLSGLGELSSGRALEVVMMPLSDLIKRRQKLQEWQEEEAVKEMLAVWSHAQAELGKGDELKLMTVEYNGIRYPFAFDLPVSVSFGDLGLARSAQDTQEYYTTLYGAGLVSLAESVQNIHPEWTEKQVLEELDRIKAGSEPREGNVVDDARAERIRGLMEGE